SSPVLFLGESGVGKTAAAKRLGRLRAEFLNQKNRPFFNINMANIPADLADSILFGHERGAFTGADKAKQGLFELANGGDLFLDEIGEASLEIQAKLLKVIEEKEFCRVGGDKTFRSYAGVIFATNGDIKEMVRTKKFREDLYARICTFDITLPSLKDRKEDIPYICESIIEELHKEHKNKRFSYSDFPDSLKEYLHRDHISFNIRGIRNDIERLMIGLKKDNTGRVVFSNWKSVLGLSKRSVFHSKRPVDYLSYSDFETLPTSFLSGKNFPGIKKAKELFEEKVLREAASQCQTKKSMAKLLGLAESNTISKMNKYRIYLSKEKNNLNKEAEV
ncbi:MAG: sigma 54-interacting transcriptional regulator, partial [Halobacteriovoraceae bacterium]|nr:sigma 54-interacting transcriptional regulator [Halobacteriovoraceae bacterium]